MRKTIVVIRHILCAGALPMEFVKGGLWCPGCGQTVDLKNTNTRGEVKTMVYEASRLHNLSSSLPLSDGTAHNRLNDYVGGRMEVRWPNGALLWGTVAEISMEGKTLHVSCVSVIRHIEEMYWVKMGDCKITFSLTGEGRRSLFQWFPSRLLVLITDGEITELSQPETIILVFSLPETRAVER